jgi:RNA polymerase sigma-70 factor (ECF subfamily)
LPLEENASDADLLTLAASGNGEAFGILMRRHEDRMFALALQMLGNRSDALDATQDAFISAFRRAGSYRGDAAVGTWLYRVGINACKDFLRKKKRWSAQGDVEETIDRRATGPGLDERVATRMEIQAALEQLSDEYREPLVMHDLGGIPYEEIASLTGTAIGTVKSRISRGRRKLAQFLEPEHPDASSKEVR